MSCYYKATPRLIPQVLLLAPPGREIILVSPWIENVLLNPPLFTTSTGTYTAHQIRLRDFLVYLCREYDTHIVIVLRKHDYRLERVVKNWPLPTHLKIVEDAYVHAKAVVTDRFVITGSVNLLPMSLFRNREGCTLAVNKYGNARRWVRENLDIWFN